jgi:thiol-disulfide isomerase/thioredoxin
MAGAVSLPAEELLVAAGYPSLPNPFGFELRVALLDWMQDNHLSVPAGSTDQALIDAYRRYWDRLRAAEAPPVVVGPGPLRLPPEDEKIVIGNMLLQLRIQYRVELPDDTPPDAVRARLDDERRKEREQAAAEADAAVRAANAPDAPRVSIPAGATSPGPTGRPAVPKPVKSSSNPGSMGGWITDFDQATASATADHRPILLLFTGSDWCPWCIKLEEEILDTGTFRNWARENLVLVYLDFPRQKALDPKLAGRNAALAKRFGITGYPTVLFVDAAGQVLVRTGYTKAGVAKWIESCNAKLGIAP